jgi:hypothetical protein
MPHILGRIKGVNLMLFKMFMAKDAAEQKKQGIELEHIWLNSDDKEEIVFLSKADDLDKAKKYIEHLHDEALKNDPNMNLPKITFLED